MSLISKKTAGAFMLLGVILILALHLFFFQSILTTLTLLVGLTLTVTFLFQPKWGFFLFLLIRPSIDSLSENFSLRLNENFSFNAGALIGALLIGLCLLYFIFTSRHRNEFKKDYVFWFFIFYLLTVAGSIFISIDRMQTFYEILRLASIFAFFCLGKSLIKKESDFFDLIWIIFISAFFPFAVAFFQLMTDSGLGGTMGIDSRLLGTFTHPNSFAAFALIIFALLSFFLLTLKENFSLSRPTVYFMLAITFFMLIDTFSRGAWLGVLVIGFILSLFRSPKIIFIGAGLISLLFFFSPAVHDRIEDLYNPPADSSVRWRYQQWEKMYTAYKKQPVWGYGAGTEIIVYEKEYGFYAGNPYTHNDFLRAALETGIGGLISYFLLIFSTGLVLFLQYLHLKEKPLGSLMLVIFALFVSEVGFSLTSNILHGTAMQWTFWALIGGALAVYQNNNLKK